MPPLHTVLLLLLISLLCSRHLLLGRLGVMPSLQTVLLLLLISLLCSRHLLLGRLRGMPPLQTVLLLLLISLLCSRHLLLGRLRMMPPPHELCCCCSPSRNLLLGRQIPHRTSYLQKDLALIEHIGEPESLIPNRISPSVRVRV